MIAYFTELLLLKKMLSNYKMFSTNYLPGQAIIRFNVTKCTIMRFTRSSSPILFNYKLNDCNLTTSSQHSYLGILLDNKLSWSSHIKNTAAKATKTLNFLKRNFSSCSPEVKASAYLTMICPVMEYAVVV